MDESTFLERYDPTAFPPTAITVDVVALTIRDGKLSVLLIERAEHPAAGTWALPGSFLQADAEDLDAAAERTLASETGIGTAALGDVHLEQLGTYGARDRDPRMRVVSVAYLAFGPSLPDPVPGRGATRAAWMPVADLGGRRLAFDHGRIVADALERGRSKLEYTPLATAFLPDTFTLPELIAVYQTVWGESLHGPNFRRKVLNTPGFVERVGARTERGGSRGGPRAELFRAGDCQLLHPPILRKATEERVR